MLLLPFLILSLCRRFTTPDLLRRVHGAAALLCAAIADGLIFSAVVKAVIVGDLFAGSDVSDGLNPHAAFGFSGFAVGVATVIDEHRHAVSIDHHRSIPESKKVGDGRVLVCGVSLVLCEARPSIFGHAHAFANRSRRIAACGMNGRRADDKAHKMCDAFLLGIELYGPHRNIEVTVVNVPTAKRIGMNRRIKVELLLGCCLAVAPLLGAQSSNAQSSAKNKTPSSTQQAPAQKPGSDANPFPEDTTNVPVIPTNGQPAATAPSTPEPERNAETTSLLHEDADPIKSPDDPVGDSSGADSGFSSSLQGADDVRIPDEPEKQGKRQKPGEPVHQESAKDDESVGAYYLDKKNWRAALSRFESALVLDPENPDVFWGLAEAQRQLGDFASAKANYLRVMEYDPDSKHSKEAKKYLKQPEIANAPAVSANQPEKQH